MTKANARVVEAATEIAATQSRRFEIAKRQASLATEQLRLADEDRAIAAKQASLQREMDRLAQPSSTKP